jgi:hypothetical protein
MTLTPALSQGEREAERRPWEKVSVGQLIEEGAGGTRMMALDQ